VGEQTLEPRVPSFGHTRSDVDAFTFLLPDVQS
jgi:hypothetical protein